MRFISDIAVGIACLSAALAVLYFLSQRQGVTRDDRLAIWLVVVGFGAVGVADITRVVLSLRPEWDALTLLQFGASLCVVAASAVVWAMLPRFLARPSTSDMIEKVNALSGEARHSAEEMARLTALKSELELAVAIRTHELDKANQRFIRALKDTDVTMAEQDRDLRYIWIHNSPHGLKRVEFVGRLQSEVLPPDLEPQIARAKHRAMAEGVAVSIDIRTTIDGEPRWYNERIEPLSRDGEITGVMTTSIDTTTYRRQEDHLRSLLRELTHRTKNLLAVIQGIARQSGRTSTDIETYVTQFSGRIRALSITHELLVSSSWRGVDLRDLLDAVWRASAPLTAQRVQLSGAAWRLAPESAQNLALAFHEMTNAVERGQSEAAAGDVQIHWAADEDGGRGVTLFWEENADAPMSSLNLDEFGKSFIETLLPRATGGASELASTDAGLRWTVKLPPRNFIP